MIAVRWSRRAAAAVGVALAVVLLVLLAWAVSRTDAAPLGGHRCPTDQTPRISASWGGDELVLDTGSYVERTGAALSARGRGSVVATTVCEVSDHEWTLRPGDSRFLAAGTLVRSVPGFDPAFRVAADGRNGPTEYDLYLPPGPRHGADLLPGVRAHVASVGVRDSRVGGPERLLPTERVAPVLDGLLSAPYAIGPPGSAADADLLVVLHLDDGTEVRRGLAPSTGRLEPGLSLPPWVVAVLRQAVA